LDLPYTLRLCHQLNAKLPKGQKEFTNTLDIDAVVAEICSRKK
jgi:hypothetical protein